MKTIIFEHNSNIYKCIFEEIKLSDSIEVDYNAYQGDLFNSFYEMDSVFNKIPFCIFLNKTLIFDSKVNDYKKMHFDIIKKIYPEIKKELNLSREEIAMFLESCNKFLNSESKTGSMPKELLIAKKIFKKEIQLSYEEMLNMPTKEYEKIHLALNMFQQAVGKS